MKKTIILTLIIFLSSCVSQQALEEIAALRDKIDHDYKNALKSKDKNKISTYRLILSGVKDLDINNRSGPNKKETDDELSLIHI